MNPKQAVLWLCIITYLAGLSQKFGVIVGLYISLLVCSFFILLTPALSYVAMISSLFSRGDTLRVVQRWAFGLWVALLVLNLVTLIFFPIIYVKTTITTVIHHVFLVPIAGMVPILVTGLSAIYCCAVAEYTSSWRRVALCFFGAIACSVAFYFFTTSFYFAQFIASLNSTAINY